MWMTRERFREELRLALEGRQWPRPRAYSFSALEGDPYIPPIDIRPSPKTEAYVTKAINDAITTALKPYAHLICEHDFKSKDSACPAFVCAKCGTRNPKWEWEYAGLGSVFCMTMGKEWKAADSQRTYTWFYRDWPKPKRGKRAR